MRNSKKIKFTVEASDTGYAAYSDKYAVYTTGKNFAELKNNMRDAFEFYMEDVEDKFSYELEAILDVPQFFEFHKVINAAAFAELIGMNKSLLGQYINRFKTPSAKQSERIIEGIKMVIDQLSRVNIKTAMA